MLKKLTFCIILAFIAGFVHPLLGQDYNQRKRPLGGIITGKVIDHADGQPVQYAYIILHKEEDNAQAGGTITKKDGRFLLHNIKPGAYYLTVKFMGFRADTLRNIRIGRKNHKVFLGEIPLYEMHLKTGTIEVLAERPAISYQIDKKVINVSKQHTVVSGTAVDVLENVPSITVDMEGNVVLRGSTSFLVLIDNKPSILEATDALQQIPASAIKDIEIITNPSAKYDPDGTAGIINIITKKNRLLGLNSLINLNTGLDDKYGADFLLSYRLDGMNLYLGGDFNSRHYPGTRTEERQTTIRDTTTFIHSKGRAVRERLTYSLRGGVDYDLTSHDVLSLGIRYGYRKGRRILTQAYEQWSRPFTSALLYDSYGMLKRWGHFYSVHLDFRHQFLKKGHVLSGSVLLQKRDGNEETHDQLRDAAGKQSGGRKAGENGPSKPLRVKIDYTRPLNSKDKFEAGYQSRFDYSEDITKLSVFDTSLNSYIPQPLFGHTVEYENNIHSLYMMYSGKKSGLGYQGGLRGEYTDREITLKGENQIFTLNRLDWYPTLHLSYKFNSGRQAMASYTRRLHRTRGWYLEPFITWIDAYNVRKGNPDLKPEYIDSYELNHQTYFGRNLFSIEAYYRITYNKIERVRRPYPGQKEVSLHTLENVGRDYMLGSELMLNMTVFKRWNINLMGSLYDYRIEGALYNRPFSKESLNWHIRFNNTFRIGSSTRLQVNGRYNSPSVSSQGRRLGYLSWNAGIRQEFLKRRFSLTLQARDIFDTAQWDFTTESPGFYSHTIYKRKAPMVMLNISYKLNHPQKKQVRNAPDDSMNEEDLF